nr:DUF3253 domain-containing protein [Halomicronema sp. CCY15110]
MSEPQIRDCLRQLVRDRGPAKTTCPAEVARALSADDWRSLIRKFEQLVWPWRKRVRSS